MAGGLDISAALKQAALDHPAVERLDTEALLAHVLGKNRTYLRTWPEKQLSPEQQQHYQALLVRCAAGEPLAYLIGWREFWSLTLKVTPATLIPRPDTEVLVEQALALIPQDARWHIADLGTGSGAIALAIAFERPGCTVVATDISSDALAIAAENAHSNGINNVEFRQGDWHGALKAGERFQLIASNPPYIDGEDDHLKHNGLPFEPQNALTPGIEGLAAIRVIVDAAKAYLTEPGWLLLEHGYNQSVAVQALLNEAGYDETQTHKDLGNNDRVTRGRLKY